MCPNAFVELYCHTTVPVLIWNVEVDFTVKDAIGTIESFDGFTAELISRDGGTQSNLTFTINALIETYVINCHYALGSGVATCQINQPGMYSGKNNVQIYIFSFYYRAPKASCKLHLPAGQLLTVILPF